MRTPWSRAWSVLSQHDVRQALWLSIRCSIEATALALLFGVPLAFIPADYGTWSVSAGAYICTFGNNLEAVNEGDEPWVVGTWGFSMTY